MIAFLLAAMTALTFTQVVARYVFNYSFVWVLELVTYLFAWLIFLGIPYGVRVGAHIGMDALVTRLGATAARVVGICAAACCAVYSVILLIGSWGYVAKMYEIGILAEDIPVQQWIPRAILIFCFALLTLRFLQIVYRIASGRQARLNLSDEAADAIEALKRRGIMGEAEQSHGGRN